MDPINEQIAEKWMKEQDAFFREHQVSPAWIVAQITGLIQEATAQLVKEIDEARQAYQNAIKPNRKCAEAVMKGK